MIRVVRRGVRCSWLAVALSMGVTSAQTEVSWRTSFAAGVLEADAAGRPLLLWAMNGHPLGCT